MEKSTALEVLFLAPLNNFFRFVFMARKLTNYILLFSLAFTFSCKKNESVGEQLSPPSEKEELEAETSKTFKIDSIREMINQRQDIVFVADSIWKDSLGITFTVKSKEKEYEFGVTGEKDEQLMFMGSLIKKESLEKGDHILPVKGYSASELLVYLDNFGPYEKWKDSILPTAEGTEKFIKEIFDGKKSNGQSQDFTSITDEFHDYSYIKQHLLKSKPVINLKDYLHFSDDRKDVLNDSLEKKTGFVAYLSYTENTLLIDNIYVPYKDIFKIESDNEPVASEDIGVMTGISYGRKAILILESDDSFNQIQGAYQAVVRGEETAEHKKILDESISGVYLKGSKSNLEEKVVNARGYNRVKAFVKLLVEGYNDKVFGAPLTFFVSDFNEHNLVGINRTYKIAIAI